VSTSYPINAYSPQLNANSYPFRYCPAPTNPFALSTILYCLHSLESNQTNAINTRSSNTSSACTSTVTCRSASASGSIGSSSRFQERYAVF
jgi:hypothetical protein